MKVIIAGGSGHLGRLLCPYLARHGFTPIILTRNRDYLSPYPLIFWDGSRPGSWTHELEGAYAVINLAGRSVNCRYNPRNRKEIFESRIHSSEVLGKAIHACRQPPKVWLQMSTATIYKHTLAEPQDENLGQIGAEEGLWSFSIRVAKAWENAAAQWAKASTRLVFLRTAMVMSTDPESPFAVLSRLARIGLGGRQGNGRQFMSWIHQEDFLRAICWLLEREHLTGPCNLAAPNPIPNQLFMQKLRKAYGQILGIPAPTWALTLGARILGTETELVLKSRHVIPGLLETDGFQFNYRKWGQAASELVERQSMGERAS